MLEQEVGIAITYLINRHANVNCRLEDWLSLMGADWELGYEHTASPRRHSDTAGERCRADVLMVQRLAATFLRNRFTR